VATNEVGRLRIFENKINHTGRDFKMKKFIVASALAGAVLMAGQNAEAANNSYKDDYVIINKTYDKLAFYQDKKLQGVYSVATGRTKALTPEGKFKIAQKIVNRPYWNTGIPGGDPRNPLGNRWLGIAVPGKSAAASWGGEYAIHGNNNPSSIGKKVSSGCIRMHDADIEKKLYPNVLLNTPVYITSSYKSFAQLTNDLRYIPAKTVTKAASTTKTSTNKVYSVRATLTGWADSSSFEIKTSTGYKVIRTTNNWYKTNLKEGQAYTFYYTTNSYGQNILTKANK
jgi:hypothetical protein